MARKLEEWVRMKTGYCLNLDKADVVDKLYDGRLYYLLLRTHNVVNDQNLKEPTANCSSKQAFGNLQTLCPWFHLIGIYHPVRFYEKVANKSVPNSLRLLYELYDRFKDAERLNIFEKPKKKSVILEKDEKPVEKEISSIFPKNTSTTKYNQYRDMIINECKEESRLRREKLKEKAVNKETDNFFPYFKDEGKKNNTDQIKLYAKQLEEKHLSTACLDEQKMAKRVEINDELLKLKMQNLFLHDIWSELLQKKKEEFDKLFRDKLNKQAEYERKLAIRLAKIHNSNLEHFERNSSKNKEVKVERLEEEKEEEEEENIEEEEEDEYDSYMLNLHKRLFAERMQRIGDDNVKMCREIVEDIADLAVIVADHRDETGSYPYRFQMNDFKELFYKGIPFFENREIPYEYDFGEEEELLEEESNPDVIHVDIKTLDTQMLKDRILTENLDKFYVHSYLYLVGEWLIEKWPELGNGKEALDIQGFQVHRWLESKYAFPPPPQSADINHFQIRVVMKYFYDPGFINCLQELLKPSDVVVVKLNDAVQYCIQRYEEENGIVLFGRKDSKEVKSTPKKKGRRGSSKKSIRRQSSRRSSKRRRSSSRRKSSKRSRSIKRQDTGAKLSSRSTPKSRRKSDLPVNNDKAVQFPSVEDLRRRVNLSQAGKLGKQAQKNQDNLDDILSSKIMVEYLKSLKNRGFVLIDFPNNVAQAALMEFLITGRPIQVALKVDDSALEYINNELHPPLKLDTSKVLNFENVMSKMIQDTMLEVIPTLNDIIVQNRLDEEKLEEMEVEVEEEEEAKVEEEVEEEAQEAEEEKNEPPKRRKSKKRQSTKRQSTKRQSTKRQSTKRQSTRRQSARRKSSKRKSTSKEKKKSIIIGPEKEEEAEVVEEEEVETYDYTWKYLEPIVKPDPNIVVVSIEELLNYRTSKILPRPNDVFFVKPIYSTYFDKCLVNFTEIKAPTEKFDKKYASLLSGLKSLDQTEVGANAYEELAAPLNFYEYFKVLYSIVHSADHVPSSKIARLILNETDDANDPARTNSLELFGPAALQICAKYKPKKVERSGSKLVGKVKPESKKSIRRQSSKRRKSSKKGTSKKKSIAKGEDKKSKTKPEKAKKEEEKDDHEIIKVKIGPEIHHTPPPDKPLPGEPGWEYIQEEVPKEVLSDLATRWEIIEQVYLQGLHQVMHLLRVHKAKYFPYRNFIRDIMEDAVNYNDERQTIVSDFQIMFNDIDNSLRQDPQMKMELECRVYELWNLLCEMSDFKKRHVESIMVNIKNRGWILSFCMTLLNVFLCLMQLEVDRFVNTVQILNEYYLAMLRGHTDDPPVEPVLIERVVIPEEEEFFILMEQEMSQEKKEMLDIIEKTIKNWDDNIFLTKGFDTSVLSDFLVIPIQQIAKKAYQTRVRVRSYINNENVGRELYVKLPRKDKKKPTKSSSAPLNERNRVYSFYLPVQRKPERRRTSTVRSRSLARLSAIKFHLPVKKFKYKPKEIDDANAGVYYEDMDIAEMDKVDFIKWEWFAAIKNECDRLAFRIKLIEAKLKEDMNEIVDLTKQTYESFSQDIAVIFHREMKAIEQLCSVFQNAIKTGTPVLGELFLEGERFYVDNEDTLYPEVPAPPNTPVEDVAPEYLFSIPQLENFVNKMAFVSPTGILERSFISILEDMIAFPEEQHLPPKWSLLDKPDLENILEQIFGQIPVYDWRNFVIFNLNISPPTSDDLVLLKEAYRQMDVLNTENINFKEFMSVPLWFEQDESSESIKKILFSLFQVSENEMNYASFLFAFCKDEDPLDGFMKALTVVDDRGVLADAEGYKKEMEKKEEIHKIVEEILLQLLHDVVLKNEEAVVTILPNDDPVTVVVEEEEEANMEEQEEEVEEEENINVLVPQEEPEEPTYPEKYNHPKWHICLPYNLVISLLEIALNFHFLGPLHSERREELNTDLFQLYEKDGKNGYIKGYILAESDVLKKLFETTGIFKWSNMSYYVQKFIENKMFAQKQQDIKFCY